MCSGRATIVNIMRFLGNVLTRSEFASILFKGKRNLYKALGYQRVITYQEYRDRYERNEIAARIIETFPVETWGGGGDLVEDEDPKTETPFEEAWEQLNLKHHVWSWCQKVDILAGIGRHAVILIGAPGQLDTPLDKCTYEQFMYLRAYDEGDCKVSVLDVDETSPRYGQPLFYSLTRIFQSATGVPNPSVAKRVHFSRLIHVADNTLDDVVYGHPRCERVWNRLDDLEKVAGGGAEAFWKRADQGRQFNIDPTIEFEKEDLDALKKEIDDYKHNLKRDLTTRGLDIKALGSDTADFSRPVDSIIGLICAGVSIPQRILVGSERGHLASSQDRSSWEMRVSSRRERFAEPYILRALIDRLIAIGVMPVPENGEYRVQWDNMTVQTPTEKADLGTKYAAMNQANATTGGAIATVDEIRTNVLDLPPMADVVPLDAPTSATQALEDKLVAKILEKL